MTFRGYLLTERRQTTKDIRKLAVIQSIHWRIISSISQLVKS